MSGYNIIILQFTHSLKHLVKFQITIAVNAGIWRGSMLIGIHKAVHNILFKPLGKVKNIVPDSHSVADISGILHIIQRTAGFLSLYSYVLIVK